MTKSLGEHLVQLYEEAYGEQDFSKLVAQGKPCKVCGCPPDKMPMIFRDTDWCCELHRKEHAQRQEEAHSQGE